MRRRHRPSSACNFIATFVPSSSNSSDVVRAADAADRRRPAAARYRARSHRPRPRRARRCRRAPPRSARRHSAPCRARSPAARNGSIAGIGCSRNGIVAAPSPIMSRRGDHRVHAAASPAPRVASIARMRPCATGLRRIAACSMPAGSKSSTILPAAAQEAQILDALDRAADERVRSRCAHAGSCPRLAGRRRARRAPPRRSGHSRCSGRYCRTAPRGCAPRRRPALRSAARARSSACPACRSRIAARDACGTTACNGVSPSSLRQAFDRDDLAPSACAASIRQERTASPSTMTVQAPQTPCSQPRCVPVSLSRARRQSASVSARLDIDRDRLAIDRRNATWHCSSASPAGRGAQARARQSAEQARGGSRRGA